jgi:hypothetical protein
MKRLTRRAVCAGLVVIPVGALLPETAAEAALVRAEPAIAPELIAADIIDRIFTVVARHDGVTAEVMRSPDRTWKAVNARRKVMYLGYQMSRLSLPEIGRRMGGRDHTTVLHAVRVVDARACTDVAFEDELHSLALQVDPQADDLIAANELRYRRPVGRSPRLMAKFF